MVGRIGLGALAALAIAGCKDKRERQAEVAPEPPPADAAAVAAQPHFVPPEVFDDWWKEASPCPEGASLRGAAPPDGTAIWCERAGGEKHGPYSSWQDAGGTLIKERRGPYADGVEHGIWQSWGPSGKKTSIVTFKQGKRHGMYREFWDGGEKKVDGWYDEGVPHGTWSSYTPTGAVAGATVIERGDGVMKRYHANGELEHQYPLQGGEVHGVWTTWDERGDKIAETTYERGRRHGPAVRWKGGVEIERGAYADDMKTGTWRERGPAGAMREVTYERGQVVERG